MMQKKLSEQIKKQLVFWFDTDIMIDISPYVDRALDRTLRCCSHSNNAYYFDDQHQAQFSAVHSGQYSIFLYYLANTIYKQENNTSLATQVYYLNKIMHAVDWYYAIDLPDYWDVEHPLNCVLGRATYSNGLYLYQGTTVGGNKGKYPTLGHHICLYANATILGNCTVGNYVLLSSGAIVIDQDIPSYSIVFGQSPNLQIKRRSCSEMEHRFLEFFKAEDSNVQRGELL